MYNRRFIEPFNYFDRVHTLILIRRPVTEQLFIKLLLMKQIKQSLNAHISSVPLSDTIYLWGSGAAPVSAEQTANSVLPLSL